MDWAKTMARQDEKHFSFGIWCDLHVYKRLHGKCGGVFCSHFYPLFDNYFVATPDHTCKRSAKGEYYKGTVSVTSSGRKCLSWRPFIKADHWRMKFPDSSIGELSNVCRNPDRKPLGPWCYVDSTGQWEYCNITLCHGEYGGYFTYFVVVR